MTNQTTQKTRQGNWSDLGTLEAIEKMIARIRRALKAIADLDGVTDALTLVDQLDDAVADIAADVEMELHEWKPRIEAH